MSSQEHEWWVMQTQTMLTKDKYEEGRVRVKFIFLKLDFDLTHWHYYFTVSADETHKGNVLFPTFKCKNNDLLYSLEQKNQIL